MHKRMRIAALLLALLLAMSGVVSALADEITVVEAGEDAEQASSDGGVEALPEGTVLSQLSEGAEAGVDPELAPELEMPAGTAEEPAEAPTEAAPVSNEGAQLVLDEPSLRLGVGESWRLTPSIIGGTAGEVVSFAFKSSNSKIAKVSADGTVTGKKKGSATIGVAASNGLIATCEVTVAKAPSSIKLNADKVTLAYDKASGKGIGFQLDYALSRKSASRVSYGGYDSAIISVSDEGWIMPKAIGSTKIKAKTFNGKSASVTVNVLPGPKSFTLSGGAVNLGQGDRFTLKPELPEDTAGSFTYRSDNPKAATVDAQTGEVEALAYGQALITATCFNGVEATCLVSVVLGPDDVSFDEESITLGVGESRALKVTATRADGQPTGGRMQFASSKTKVATVDGDGVVTGKKKGTAKIGVAAPGGATDVCTVKVLPAPKSISLKPAGMMLRYDPSTGKGETLQLAWSLSKGSASRVVFGGYDEKVVSVSEDGLVAAVGLGTTTITAATFNGMTASCTVRVQDPGAAHATDNVAHRGGAGYWEENTLEAFRNAPSTGANMVELDVRTTKDGVQIIHHDPYFTAGGKKYTIRKKNLAQIRKLKPSICTLDEALDVIADTGMYMLLELKDTADPAKSVKAVKAHGLQGRTTYISFEKSLLKEVRKLDKSAPLGYIIYKAPSDLNSLIASLNLSMICQRHDHLTQSNVVKWQGMGLHVNVWTLDDMDLIEHFLDWGVDSITSNYPKLTTQALKRRK